MNLAIHNWMRAEPLPTTLRRISSLGYEYLEIQGAPDLYDVGEVRELLVEHQVKCWGSVTLMGGDLNLVARNAEQRKKSITYVKSLVDMVGQLGGRMVSVVPATVGKIVPDGKPAEEWQWAVGSMRECYAYAEDHGIRLGIEPINRFETYFINRAEQAYALAAATGDNCGVCLDIFHMCLEESDYLSAIRSSADRLIGFHVADNNRMAPGMGSVDWKELTDVLREVKFTGPLSVEFCPPLDRTPANPYPDSIDENPEGLTPEQLKFLEDHGSSAFTEEFYTMLTKRSAETLGQVW